MANSHATQAKNSLLKKLPVAYAQGLCDSVRKFFAACQENIYSTVRNILCVQSETFCMYSQKHSACTVRNIPTVLAEKSPQIARISRLVTIFALLFCVCGAMSAWGQQVATTYTWKGADGANFAVRSSWKEGSFPGINFESATLIFENNANVTVTVQPSSNFFDLEIQLQNNAKVIITSTNVFNFNAVNSITISGAGELILSGINFNGGTSNQGTINIKNGTSLTTNNTINAATLTNNGTLTLNTGGSISVGTSWTNNGTVNVKDTAAVALPNAAANVDENGKWVYNNTSGTSRNLVIPYGAVDTLTNQNLDNRFFYKELEIENGEVVIPANYSAGVRSVGNDVGKFTVKPGATFTINGSFLAHNTKRNGSTADSLTSANIEQGGTLKITSADAIFRSAGNTTNAGEIYLTEGLLDRNYGTSTFTNTGTILVDNGGDYRTSSVNFTENGTWIYVSNRTKLFAIKNDNIQSYNNLQIGNGPSSPTVTLNDAVTATGKITVSQNATLNANNNVTAGSFENSGTATLGGTTTVTGEFKNNSTMNINGTVNNTQLVSNSASSTVIFGGNSDINISNFATTYGNLSVIAPTANNRTITFSGNTTIQGTMSLRGTATYRTTVKGENNANILLAAGNTGVGSWLNIDYNSVSINGGSTTNTYDVRTNCFDVTGASAYDNKNGWLFPPTPYTSDIYFWVGGGGDNNWGTRGNWKYDSATGVSANEAPGTKPNAEVHIEPTATETVTLNVSPLANPIKDITINSDGTLAIGTNNLIVQNSWTNNGTVTITSGNATLPTGTTDNGTWNYTTTRTGLVGLTYNNLNISGGTVTVTANNDVVANGTVEIARNCVLIAESGFKSANLYVRGRFEDRANSNVEITDTLHTFHDDNRTNWGTVRVYSHQIKAKNIINEKTIYLFTAGTSGTIEILTDNFNNKFSRGDYWGNRCGEIVTSTGNQGRTNLPVKIVGYDGISPTTVENTGLMIFDNGLTVIGTLTNNVATGGTPGSITIGSGTSTISGNFTNAGTITITSTNTTLNVTGTTTNSGTFTNNANAGVTFNSNNTFTNTGTVTNNTGATFNMNAPLTNNGAAIITNNGTFNFQTGTFTNETNATFANDNTVKIKSGAVITNNGTITNGNTSTVEYYGDAANTTATPNFGTTYHNLIATTANGLRSFNFDKDITVNGDMTLSGANGNRLVIDGTPGTNITLSPANMQTGDWLQINYNNVSVNAQSFSPAYKVENSVDRAGNRAFGLQRGWQFPENNLYYWVNGTGNNDWTEPNNWRLGSPTSTSAPVTYPGNASRTPATTNAEVFISQISPAANIILNTTATINAIEITDANATLALGTNDLTVNNSWSNRGKITLESGNVNFGASASITENGTWSYNNTTNRNLANITYNNLELAGTNTNTITPTAAITANSVSINTNTTLVLGANDLTVRNSWSNSGTVTITSGNANLPAGMTDNGTWTYNNTTSRSLANIVYNNLELSGTNINTITPAAAVTANNININSNTILALGANNLSVQNTWTNDGTVTVTSGNATFATPATDSGTWTYTSSRTGLIRNITYKDVDIGDGTNSINVVLNSGLDSTGTLEIKNGCQLDLVNHSVSANNINNNGTVRLYGTQSVTGANNTGKPTFTGGNSGNVEFYGNTGTTSIDVSKMGTSYGNLTVSGYNKTLEFTGTTTVAGDLILKGSNDNAPLTIASSGGAIINVAKAQGTTSEARGIYLAIDRKNVNFTGTRIDNINGNDYFYWADNSYDTNTDYPAALAAIRGGWRIPTIELTNMQLSVAPLGGNTVYVRAVQSTMDNLAKVAPKILTRLNLFFNVTNGSAGKIATVSSASLIYNGGKVAWIRLILSGLSNITVDNLKNYYVQTYVTNSGTISDEYHPLSDFAVGAVNPLFAYDNRYADSDANWQTSAFSSGVAVRNWDAGQGSDGSLLSKKDIVMSARLAGGSGNDMGNPVLYLSNNPTSGSQAGKYNGDTNSSWRVWLPDVTGVGELAGTPNGNAINNAITVSGSGTNPIFNIPAGSNSSYGNWKDGDQITFMFGVTDAATGNLIEVGGAEGSLAGVTKHPLYALRLRDAGDINSLDLWSVRLRGMTAHRGGVSIRNNVINVTTGEQVTIEVDMPTSGTLNVMVMTLDGSIVKYLQHGTASEGKHAYHWGGLTNSGSPVARGLYFVRVVGSGIDETRKVMVVK